MNELLADVAAAWPRELLPVALVAHETLDSTQRLARELLDRHLAEDETPPICCVLALEQSQGRGRRGRSWESASGLGVWATLELAMPPAALGAAPLRAALALGEALAIVAPALRLKWPNDLVVADRKLGGVLVESVQRDGRAWALVGFGIDLEHGEAELPTPQATSLRLLGVSAPERALATWAPRAIAAVWRELSGEAGDWLVRYRALSAHVAGDALRCDLDGERIDGRFVEVDGSGALHLRCADGERVVTSGDVYAW
jgi:BirA family biotin operon repressor/biotin-[acetyl-CoA-carboxylase] ligase